MLCWRRRNRPSDLSPASDGALPMVSSTRKAVDLLSMYDDDEDEFDDESAPPSLPAEDSAPLLKTPNLPSPAMSQTLTPPFSTPNPLSDAVDARKAVTGGAFGIVDYGQDESAMSPEAEDMEIEDSGRVVIGAELELGYSQVAAPRIVGSAPAQAVGAPQVTSPPAAGLQEQPKGEDLGVMHSSDEIGGGQTNEPAADSTELQREVELLAKFLPPPPEFPCSEELQEKFNKFLAYQRAGKSFNTDLRNRKDYRNPDFLLHAVTYQRIDQIGTCFSKDVFDPHAYDPNDYYDAIEADMKREMERKEQERKRSPKVEFVHGNVQPATVIPQMRIGGQIPVPVAAGGLHPVPQLVADPSARDGRANKKSKWDKV